MHIIGLVEHPEHVCCRYRLAAYRPALEAEGHTLELRAVPRGFWRRTRFWRALRHADVVILQRKLLACWHLLLLRRHARRLVFDFDDAVFQRDSYARKPHAGGSRLRRFTATVHAADAVVAGNEYLRQQAARFTSIGRTHVIPTCVDPHRYPPAEHHRRGDGVQLVWIGSASTAQGLEQARPLLEHVGRQVPGVRLKLICDRFPAFDGLPTVPVAWSAATEACELAAADIGISWVPDDEWSRGKCGLKVLQYMAAGLPVVANPVGVQAELVRPGVTGYLAATAAEWVEAVRRLAADPALRQRLGRAGRRFVERHYAVAEGAERWLRLLRTLAPPVQPLAA